MRLRAVAAAAILASATALCGTAASAAGSFRSTTTLRAAISQDGRRLVLTATVAGTFGATSGSVVFIDNQHHVLGTQPLPTCSDTCQVVQRVKVSALPPRVNAVFASYGGNATLRSSSAAQPILYLRCRKAQACGATLTGSQTSIGVTIAKGQTALATLGAQRLPCSLGAGQVANLATTGGSAPMQVVLYEAGEAGTAYVDADGSTFDSGAGHSAYRCLVTSSAFTGFSPGASTGFSGSSADFSHYGTAPRLGNGHYKGQYIGLIADCYHLATHAHTEAGACENLPKLGGSVPDEVLIALTGGNRVSHFAG